MNADEVNARIAQTARDAAKAAREGDKAALSRAERTLAKIGPARVPPGAGRGVRR